MFKMFPCELEMDSVNDPTIANVPVTFQLSDPKYVGKPCETPAAAARVNFGPKVNRAPPSATSGGRSWVSGKDVVIRS